MTIDVLGYQVLNFKDQETGKLVEGYNLFFAEPITSRGAGNAYIKKFIRSDLVEGSVSLGPAELDMQLTLKGRPFVNSFRMLPAAPSARQAAGK